MLILCSLTNTQEYWCKRLHPKNVCEKVYRQPPLRESLKKGKLRKQDFAVTKHKTVLLQAANSIGRRIQYDCAGFLPNRRQVTLQLVYEVYLQLIYCCFFCLVSYLFFLVLFCSVNLFPLIWRFNVIKNIALKLIFVLEAVLPAKNVISCLYNCTWST